MADTYEERELLIPLRPHMAAQMRLPFPMTSGDWNQMMNVLEAMRPGIVRDAEILPPLPGGTDD